MLATLTRAFTYQSPELMAERGVLIKDLAVQTNQWQLLRGQKWPDIKRDEHNREQGLQLGFVSYRVRL
jgi:hypothetical protein